jgi:hypothetical protein
LEIAVKSTDIRENNIHHASCTLQAKATITDDFPQLSVHVRAVACSQICAWHRNKQYTLVKLPGKWHSFAKGEKYPICGEVTGTKMCVNLLTAFAEMRVPGMQ